jgi:anti-anti-sigma regulatory factor
MAIHWHLVGGYLRPLHEQIDALVDASVWGAVVAEVVNPDDAVSPRLVALERTTLTLTSVQHGTDYAAIVIAGTLDRHSVQQSRRQIDAVLSAGVSHLVIDLSAAVPAAGGRLAALLIKARTVLRARQGTLLLLGAAGVVEPMLMDGELAGTLSTCDRA